MNRFFSLLKTMFSAAAPFVAPILAVYQPALAPLANTIISSILAAQRYMPDAQEGAMRSQYAMTLVASQIPQLIVDIEKATGKKLVDEGKLAAGIQALNDAHVSIMNSFGMLETKQ